MPLYEYTCSACGHHFDKLVRAMSDRASDKSACPECGSMKTARSLSVFAVAADTKSAGAAAPAAGMCGCGRKPGSCMS